MTCAEAQEQLHDLARGRLDSRTAEAVRAHVNACPRCADLLSTEAALHTRIRAEVRRYAAPADLRARIESLLKPAPVPIRPAQRVPFWRSWLTAHSWAAASIGALAVLVLVWGGWSWWRSASEPPLLTAALAEHTEYRQEAMPASPPPDPRATVDRLRTEASYPLPPTFLGDAGVQFVKGTVTALAGTRAIALVYRDAERRYSTLFLLPGAGIEVPAEGRTKIETFAPFRKALSGREVYLWKQAGAACVLVSDLDPAGSAEMFLKIRKSA